MIKRSRLNKARIARLTRNHVARPHANAMLVAGTAGISAMRISVPELDFRRRALALIDAGTV